MFRRSLHALPRAAGSVALGAWAVLIIIPFFVMLLSSTKSNADMYAHPFSVDLGHARWSNYTAALNGPPGGQPLTSYFKNTVIVVIVSLAIGMTFGMFGGYSLARSKSRVASWANRYFVLLLTIPVLVTLVPIFDIFGTLNWRNHLMPLSLVYAAFMLPPTVVLSRSYFAAFPADILEAGELDGAGEMRLFGWIVLPVAWRSLVGIGMLNLIWVWSELAFALVLLIDPSSKTLPVGLLAFQGEYTTDYGAQFAGLIIAILPLLIIYAFFNRRITSGMAAGLLK